jgi:serine/threonine protein kinase
MLQILDGLIYAHQMQVSNVESASGKKEKIKGFFHQDLNPNNILITYIHRTTVAKIGYYALARAFDFAGLSDHSFTGTQMGTPAFIPRQQLLAGIKYYEALVLNT